LTAYLAHECVNFSETQPKRYDQETAELVGQFGLMTAKLYEL